MSSILVPLGYFVGVSSPSPPMTRIHVMRIKPIWFLWHVRRLSCDMESLWFHCRYNSLQICYAWLSIQSLLPQSLLFDHIISHDTAMLLDKMIMRPSLILSNP